ncbi:oocyte zinc finger protein XlCOF6-like [Conger conger]|uniref:oocyte zinc finger protein XlCOF6-like n=1 Tax=Conger conger TaxID=82655 RepID=UPI002A5A3906|nr:oocyte zinc finger protein XlCOF6-like [Conger conger]XP_061075378.1 oocyte zinc finger protein XlCOF6-like [Conger conger]
MMQTGVCLRQDTETTLPELTEQHRIRLKEEELGGLVHMAESETCAAAGLNTLEPVCVTLHRGVSDVHHAHTSLIKTETDLGFTHPGDLIKKETLDSAELGYVTHLHPDQIKTETDDGGYLQAEHISDLKNIICVHLESDELKCESSDSSVSDFMKTMMNGAAGDHKAKTEPSQCAGEPNPNCKKEEMHDPLIQCGDLNHHCHINGENSQTRIAQKSRNRTNKHINCQGTSERTEPMITNSSDIPSLLNLFQMEANHRSERQINSDEKPYKCTWCGKCFNLKSGLNRHLTVHTGEKPYKCTHCGKCFPRKCYLNIHQRTHTGEKPYNCTLCGKCFSTQSNLNSHKIIHTGEKPYECTHCGKCFSIKSYLNIHQRTHAGEKPHKCTLCGKCFSRQTNLNSHKIIHTGEKPYKCTHCGKCFSIKSYLNIHQKTHAGEKPYSCTQCGKCFSTQSNLNSHKIIHTGEKPYKCTQCGKCFSSKWLLNRHQIIHSGEKTL